MNCSVHGMAIPATLARASFTVLLAWNAATSATAADAVSTDPNVISRAAIDAVRIQAAEAADSLRLTAQPTDIRLHLPVCSQPLAAHIGGDGRLRQHVAVNVRCEGNARWNVFVSVTIESQITVLLARHALPSGTPALAADFESAVRRVPGLPNDYAAADTLAGRRLRRTLAPGDALTLEELEADNLIHRGQQVTLLAHLNGIEVRMSGIALADGRQADRIHVQNLSSQRVVEGVVRSDSVVEALL
jgi:flagella basal body P-ring formation protein FlgA